MKVYKHRSKLTGLPDRFEELFATQGWDESIDKCVDGIRLCGNAVTDLTCSFNSAETDDWLFAARFLGAGNPQYWPSTSPKSAPAQVLENVVDPNGNIRIVVKYLVKKLLSEDEDSTVESKLMLRDRLRDAVQQLDWNRECVSLRHDLFATFKALRLAATTSAVTLRGGAKPWYAVAIFLLIMPVPDPDSPNSCFTEFSIDGFAQSWLSKMPNTRGSRQRESRLKTGQDPFDPRNACDFQNRVFTWGSGQTHVPGSRRDNRGHR
jgi:hypothetical protein